MPQLDKSPNDRDAGGDGAAVTLGAMLVGAAVAYLVSHLTINIAFMALTTFADVKAAGQKAADAVIGSDVTLASLIGTGLGLTTLKVVYQNGSLDLLPAAVMVGVLSGVLTWLVLKNQNRASAQQSALALAPALAAMNDGALADQNPYPHRPSKFLEGLRIAFNENVNPEQAQRDRDAQREAEERLKGAA